MYGRSKLLNSQAFSHFFVEETLAGAVRLNPFAINHKLRDGALAGAGDDFFGSAGGGLDVDFMEGDAVVFQKALGHAALGAPESGVDSEFHVVKTGGQKPLTAKDAKVREEREEKQSQESRAAFLCVLGVYFLGELCGQKLLNVENP
jgi:hypothetical protein